MADQPIHQLTARQLHAEVMSGALTLVEIADALMGRIEALNPTLNAFVDADRHDVACQIASIEVLRASGQSLPLLGAVFSIKDNLWLGGRPATYGSPLYRDFVAPHDSACVARLKAMGALCVGVTNSAELACKGYTSNPLHGVTRNPWDLGVTPGGSSGGAAAAVAAGLAPLALGTDAGGSVRRPAAHTGLVGFKPSHGAIPDPQGFVDPSQSISDIGVLAKNVEDCAWLLDALIHVDRRDPRSLPIGTLGRTPAFTAALNDEAAQRWRVAVSADLGCGFSLDADVAEAFEALVAGLSDTDIEIVRASPQWPAGTGEYPLLQQQQAALAAHFGEKQTLHPGWFGVGLSEQIAEGRKVSGADYARDEWRQRELYRALMDFFEGFDLLLCPTAPVEAWAIERDYPVTIGGQPASSRGHAAFTPLFNYCQVPALSLPFALGRRGLPLGVQIVGPRLADVDVVTFARYLERHIGQSFDSPIWLGESLSAQG
jgi:aspartyl-tRNA(Asn)/glutamyl-tRNA(Gln) amidotransferase subunit A